MDNNSGLKGIDFSPEINMTRYLQKIRTYPILSQDEEYKLAVKYKETRNQEIAKVLVNSHLRLVVKVVAKYRESSKAPSTREYANRPHLFVQRTYIDAPFIFIPEVSSERREYIPIGYMMNGEVASNKAFSVYNAPLWLFAVLTSKMHNIWVRTIGGALETRISYSSNLCYNSFPFPKLSETNRVNLISMAEQILLVRENHTEMTLGEMYNPETMPQDLRYAHQALDLAVERCYRPEPFTSDEERLEHLFKLYEKMTK